MEDMDGLMNDWHANDDDNAMLLLLLLLLLFLFMLLFVDVADLATEVVVIARVYKELVLVLDLVRGTVMRYLLL